MGKGKSKIEFKFDLPRKDEAGRPYLSYSQISTWKKSKRDYIRQYFFGESFEGNAYTEFGSKIGEALETGDFSDFTKEEIKTMKLIPRLDQFERKVRLNFEDFYILGFIDTNSFDYKKIKDYKTGDMSKESEYDNDDYFQLEIYAMALEQEVGVLPEEASVVLIERTGNAFKGEELKLGTQLKEIPRSLDPDRLKSVREDIQAIAEDISYHYNIFKQLLGNEQNTEKQG